VDQRFAFFAAIRHLLKGESSRKYRKENVARALQLLALKKLIKQKK